MEKPDHHRCWTVKKIICSEVAAESISLLSYQNSVRNLFAIVLIAVHLFNIGGYRFVFDHFEQKASSKMLSKLDKLEYNEAELIEVKVPIRLPYQTDWKDFERYDGEIEINGVHYNYVKRKVQNDSLILLCIPNTDKMKIYNAREEFFSLVNDLQQNNDRKAPASKSNIIKTITSDYNNQPEEFVLADPSGSEAVLKYLNERLIPAFALPSPEKPPEALA